MSRPRSPDLDEAEDSDSELLGGRARQRGRWTTPVALSNAHVVQEQRRRNRMNAAFDELRAAVPSIGPCHKADFLVRVAAYVRQLRQRAERGAEDAHALAPQGAGPTDDAAAPHYAADPAEDEPDLGDLARAASMEAAVSAAAVAAAERARAQQRFRSTLHRDPQLAAAIGASVSGSVLAPAGVTVASALGARPQPADAGLSLIAALHARDAPIIAAAQLESAASAAAGGGERYYAAAGVTSFGELLQRHLHAATSAPPAPPPRPTPPPPTTTKRQLPDTPWGPGLATLQHFVSLAAAAAAATVGDKTAAAPQLTAEHTQILIDMLQAIQAKLASLG